MSSVIQAVLLAFYLWFAGCASVPEVDGVIDHNFHNGDSPRIIGAHGPLTEKQSKALLERLGADGRVMDALQRHLAIEQAVAETPLVDGNGTRLLRDGVQSFQAIFHAVRNAKHHINLEYYIFEDVESAGEHLGDLLIAKQQAGVQVNLIYDSVGSINTPAELFDRLRQAGVKVVQFNPLNPLKAKRSYSINDRDHRKILIVDGATGIVGGVNLSKTYQSLPFEGGDGKAEYWRDTDMQIDGPVVAQLQKLFVEQWARQQGPPLDAANFYPNVPARGKEVIRIIGSSPHNLVSRYYVTLISAIRNAEKSIFLSASYFVPTPAEKQALVHAARRGVDVRLLLPDRSDAKPALAIQHSHYSDLLKAGIKIFESHNVILHSKTVVIDGVWSTIGSSNFDHRSVLFNDEVDVVILGSATGSELEHMFQQDVRKARPIDLATWQKRPWWRKLQEAFSRLVQRLF